MYVKTQLLRQPTPHFNTYPENSSSSLIMQNAEVGPDSSTFVSVWKEIVMLPITCDDNQNRNLSKGGFL